MILDHGIVYHALWEHELSLFATRNALPILGNSKEDGGQAQSKERRRRTRIKKMKMKRIGKRPLGFVTHIIKIEAKRHRLCHSGIQVSNF